MSTKRDDTLKDDTRNDRYLWDRSGKPGPELQRLETLLGQFRHSGAPLVIPSDGTFQPANLQASWSRMPWFPRVAATLVVATSLAASIFLALNSLPRLGSATGSWEVACLQGEIQVAASPLAAGQTIRKLGVGQLLETNGVSRASISEKSFGQIDVERNSRLRLEQSGDQGTRMQLDQGTIHAAIWAPPGHFVVDTPSAMAVDLGCAYTLQVSSDGSGSIHTTIGWVGFHLNGRESFIPAGAMCSTRPRVGPGTPYFEDAAATFREALANFDSAEESNRQPAPALATVLAQARPRDGLTLWHLLSRTDGQERAEVYDRFAVLVPPPEGVTRDGILRLDRSMLDLWWNSLRLGDISIWRFWEQSSSPSAAVGAAISRETQNSVQPVQSAR